MSVCHGCACAANSGDKPSDVSDETDAAAHVIADAMGSKVYYSQRGRFGGTRLYIGGGGAVEIPVDKVPSERLSAYIRTVKIDAPGHGRPRIGVSFEVHYMEVETAEALFRWLFNREDQP